MDPGYRNGDQTGCAESNDGTGDAEKLQGGQLNQAATKQLCCLERIAQQSLFTHDSIEVIQHGIIDDCVWDDCFQKELYPSDHRPVLSDLKFIG